MATEKLYSGDGSDTTFDIPFPYLTHADIKVFLKDVKSEATEPYDANDYHYVNKSDPGDYSISGNTVTFTTAPADGTTGGDNNLLKNNIKITRATVITSPEHEYSAGSSITAARLNENQRQALYAIEEAGEITATPGGISTGDKGPIFVENDASWVINDNSIANTHLQDNSVGINEIQANAVTAGELAPDAVNGSKIADNSINSEHYVDGSIDSEHLAANIITESMLQSNSVTLAKLASALLTELKTTYSNPVGTVIWVASFNPPKGYLKANGETINNGNTTFPIPSSPNQTLHNWHWESNAGVIGTIDTSALYAIVGSKIPDLRGEFIRGATYARAGIDDTGATIHGGSGGPSHLSEGSVLRTQSDNLKSHTHEYIYRSGNFTGDYHDEAVDAWKGLDTDFPTGATGGTETRPRNIALLACIKY